MPTFLTPALGTRSAANRVPLPVCHQPRVHFGENDINGPLVHYDWIALLCHDADVVRRYVRAGARGRSYALVCIHK